VAYREAITKAASARGRFVRQTGGRGQFGDCTIEIEPGDPGSGYHFENQIVGGKIPREYIPAVNKGAEEALHTGIIAGYPVMDVRVSLVDGSFHPVDSSEMAFKIAGSMALKDALRRAGSILLEPVMELQVVTPGEYLGEVLADLNGRRGRIKTMEGQGDTQVVEADAPLVEMFGYATDLRSLSQGRANYSMEFGRYEKAPNSTVESVARSA
jgi:elongation factor G